jgi:hypothetical protein
MASSDAPTPSISGSRRGPMTGTNTIHHAAPQTASSPTTAGSPWFFGSVSVHACSRSQPRRLSTVSTRDSPRARPGPRGTGWCPSAGQPAEHERYADPEQQAGDDRPPRLRARPPRCPVVRHAAGRRPVPLVGGRPGDRDVEAVVGPHGVLGVVVMLVTLPGLRAGRRAAWRASARWARYSRSATAARS